MKKQTLPQRYFKDFMFGGANEVLDFGLQTTPLHNAEKLAKWLGVKECFLKIEIGHPTSTVKDRSTEIAYSFFKKNNINKYIHASTGNTGTSLVWGLGEYKQPFELTLFVPGKQLSHHNFSKAKGLTTILLEDATYDEARKYCEKYIKEKNLTDLFAPYKKYRPLTYQVPFFESFEQLEGKNIDYIFQTVSGGSGIVGAHKAAQSALASGLLKKMPRISIAQPDSADVMTRCFNAGFETYNEKFNQIVGTESKAWAIRRGDGTGSYEKLYSVLKETGGVAISVSEKEMEEAKQKLFELEGIEAGYTACVSLAGIKKEAEVNQELRKASMLVLLTGIDRPSKVTLVMDSIIKKEEWVKKVYE